MTYCNIYLPGKNGNSNLEANIWFGLSVVFLVITIALGIWRSKI